MDPDHELAVAQGLREGQADAWRALYDAHAEALWYWVARRMGGRTADVADVVQETFLAAAKSAGQFDGRRGSLWTWLIGIARNHVALHFRREERHAPATHAERWRFAGDGRLDRWLDGQDDAPDASLQTAELADLVRFVLARMSPDYETILTARYLDGVAVEELAEESDTTITAIRSKLARARNAFREALSGLSDQILEALVPEEIPRSEIPDPRLQIPSV